MSLVSCVWGVLAVDMEVVHQEDDKVLLRILADRPLAWHVVIHKDAYDWWSPGISTPKAHGVVSPALATMGILFLL